VTVVAEPVELELGFEGGGLLRCGVSAAAVDDLVRSLGRDERDDLFSLGTERGRVVVDLRRLTYVRAFGRRKQVGFGT
jgi:hypothetical protein